MPFDPDAFLAAPVQASPAPISAGFNPDAFLASGPAGSAPLPTQTEPSRLEAALRGAGQGLTLGFSDEIAGALGSLFSDKSYGQIRDESRAANQAAQQAHGGFYLGGELAGGLATSLIPGLNVAKGASVAKAGLQSAGLGAVAGLGGSSADLTKGDFSGAVKDSLESALLGGVIGAGAQKLSKTIQGAPEAAKDDLLKLVTQGEGKFGGSTTKLKKLVAGKEEPIQEVLAEKFKNDAGKTVSLDKIIGKPAKEVLPVLEQRMDEIGSELTPLYSKIDQATGGVSMRGFAAAMDDEINKLAKEGLNETRIKAVQDIKDSILKAHAPDLFEKLKGNKKMEALGMGSVFDNLEDTQIPTQQFRKYVTKIQTKGTEVINALNPGDSTKVKADMAKLMTGLMSDELSMAAANHPQLAEDVAKIAQVNRKYSALATMFEAIEQRGWKEANKSESGKGLLHGLLGHAGLAGAGALAMHGNIPGAVASVAIPKLIEKAPAASRAATRGLAATDELLSQLRHAAELGSPWAKSALAGLEGTPTAGIIAGGVSAQD